MNCDIFRAHVNCFFFAASYRYLFLKPRDKVTVLVVFDVWRVVVIQFGVENVTFKPINQFVKCFISAAVVAKFVAHGLEFVQFAIMVTQKSLSGRNGWIKLVEKFIGRQDFSESEAVESGDDFAIESDGEIFPVVIDMPTVILGGSVKSIESVNNGKHFVGCDVFFDAYWMRVVDRTPSALNHYLPKLIFVSVPEFNIFAVGDLDKIFAESFRGVGVKIKAGTVFGRRDEN